jgi:hypothetical protein
VKLTKKAIFIAAHTVDIDMTDARQILVAGVPLAAPVNKAFLAGQTQSSSYETMMNYVLKVLIHCRLFI